LHSENDLAETLARAGEAVFDGFRSGASVRGELLHGPALIILLLEQLGFVSGQLRQGISGGRAGGREVCEWRCGATLGLLPMGESFEQKGAAANSALVIHQGAAHHTGQPAAEFGLVVKHFDVPREAKVYLLHYIEGVIRRSEAAGGEPQQADIELAVKDAPGLITAVAHLAGQQGHFEDLVVARELVGHKS
jgi:hypothetical protein